VKRNLFEKLKRRQFHVENTVEHFARGVKSVVCGKNIIAGYTEQFPDKPSL
jgi:hypothetical protein